MTASALHRRNVFMVRLEEERCIVRVSTLGWAPDLCLGLLSFGSCIFQSSGTTHGARVWTALFGSSVMALHQGCLLGSCALVGTLLLRPRHGGA